jgi:Protein of unknown function (DUF2589)
LLSRDAGPLSAVVTAQAVAAAATIQFINAAGFDADRKAKSAEFQYTTVNPTTGLVEQKILRVPVLVLLPIPSLRVSDTPLDHVSRDLPPMLRLSFTAIYRFSHWQ